MEITGNITKQGQTTGVRIKDGDIVYCLKLNLLTCRMIFEGLIESGYAYTSYPYGFTKNGKTIQDMEEVPYDALSQEDKNDFAIPPGESDFLQEAELKTHLPEGQRFIALRPKNETPIKTREEFLAFLISTQGSTQIAENPETYLPLNYLVADEALFTIGEYYHKRNGKYRELIENRERLSFDCYRRLVDWMIDTDAMPPDFNALDFKRAYYSWGVPGISTQVFSVSENDVSSLILHSSVSNNLKLSANIHYFKRDGVLNPPLIAGQSVIGADWVETRKDELAEDELCLVSSSLPVLNKVITMNCAGFTVEFDENNKRIRQKDDEYVNPILQIRSVGGGELDTRFFNTVRRETREAYMKDLVISACVEHLIEKTTVITDKTSFKAIQAGLSLSPSATIRYMIACLALREEHRVDLGYVAPIDGRDAENSELLNTYQAAYQFLPDMLAAQPEDFDINIFSEVFNADPFLVSDLISGIISGDTNIDDIESGYIADRSLSRAPIHHIIEFAESRMGYSMSEIIDAVTAFDPYTDVDLVFRKDGIGTIKISIPVRGQQEESYVNEVANYRALSASTALSWHYVISAMAEPGKNEGRHCAARVLSWTHRISNDASSAYQSRIEGALLDLVMKSVESIEDAPERKAAARCADMAVANLLFGARLSCKKEFDLPPFFGGMTVTIPDHIFYEIEKSKNFHEQVESTYGLCDHAVDGSDIHIYFVNARVTPHHIIPNTGVKIAEVPFLPFWDAAEKPDFFRQHGNLLPASDFRGYRGIYYMMCSTLPAQTHPGDEEPSLTSPYSLRVYYKKLMEYRDEAMKTKTNHILTPPSLVELYQPYFYTKRPEIPCEPKDFYDKWLHSPPRTLTHENARTGESVADNLLEEAIPCVVWVNGFSLEDYIQLPQDIAYDINTACSDRVKAVQYLGDSVRFMDGYTHNFKESDIDDTKYAVIKTPSTTYIPFANGKIAKTDERAFGG